MIDIPSWEEAERAVKGGNATPLDEFVYHNEPAGKNDIEFRAQLNALVGYVCGLTLRAVDVLDSSQKSKSLAQPAHH